MALLNENIYIKYGANKIDEYVPIITPIIIINEKSLIIGPPKKNKGIKTINTVITVNIVLGQEEFSYAADINSDNIINIFDIVSLVNIVLSP